MTEIRSSAGAPLYINEGADFPGKKQWYRTDQLKKTFPGKNFWTCFTAAVLEVHLL